MRTLARYSMTGLAVGALIATLLLLSFPHFLGALGEVVAMISITGVAGLIAGGIAVAIERVRGSGATSALSRRHMTVAGICIVLAFIAYAVTAPARSWRVSPRLVMLCIDGGTWTVVDPLIEAGRMPNLARLRSDGASAVLLSEEPMFSMILWTTIGAGVRPDKHGIRSFYDTQDHLRSKRFWEVFEDAGHSIGMFRWWITWPPRVKNGFAIPGILARDASAMPPAYNFVNQLRMDMKSGLAMSPSVILGTGWRYLRAGLRLKTCIAIAQEVLPALRSGRFADFHIASRRAEIRLNADVYCHLLREFKPEFTCFYDNGVDQMSHFYWQYHRPQDFDHVDAADIALYGDAVPGYYELQDAVFGQILDHVGPDANIVVLSDHGFAAVETGAADFFFTSGVPVLEDLAMSDAYYSVALASRTFVESVKRDPAANAAALQSAVVAFNSLRVVETGDRLFRAWVEDEGRIQLDVSDSLRSLDGHVETPGGPVPVKHWFTTRIYTGTHDAEGIFIASGEAFRMGHSGRRAELVDIAPTILYINDFPLSRELDGEVVWDWIAPEFRSSREVAWVESYGHYDPARTDVEVDKKTLEKLRALGYVR